MYLKRDNDTDRLQKSVYIYTFVFTGTYTGPFCHNPVESRLILPDSGSIPLESSGFLWNPVESGGMDAFLQESVGHQKVQEGSRDPSPTNASTVETLIGMYLASIPLHGSPGIPLLTIT